MKINIQTVDYLTQKEVIQQIRIAVFQVEQGVDPALEFDHYDATAIHLLAYLDQVPVGTARMRYVSEDKAKIERLAVLKSARGQGIGLKLMQFAIEWIQGQGKAKQIMVHAQDYIKSLYQKLGFIIVGEPFDEANILHVKMIKELENVYQ